MEIISRKIIVQEVLTIMPYYSMSGMDYLLLFIKVMTPQIATTAAIP